MAKKSSYRVLPDGREKLTGYQWTKRVRELKVRAAGYCESILVDHPEAENHPTHFIGDDGDAHHLTPRSKQRDDSLSNLAYICRPLHIAIDSRKIGGRK